ncbi:MAG: RNA polymerase sigma factor [Acidimicrobiia bacterium]
MDRADGGQRNGEEIARWYAELFDALAGLAFLLTGSRAVAEDVVQNVFTRCAARLPGLQHPPSYLRAAVVNECRTHHRRAARFTEQPDNPELLPIELLELRDALARLSERRRAAVVLRYFCDLDMDEIAQLLDCRPATVRSLLHRGVNELRGALR